MYVYTYMYINIRIRTFSRTALGERSIGIQHYYFNSRFYFYTLNSQRTDKMMTARSALYNIIYTLTRCNNNNTVQRCIIAQAVVRPRLHIFLLYLMHKYNILFDIFFKCTNTLDTLLNVFFF